MARVVLDRRLGLIRVTGSNTPAGWVSAETSLGAVWAGREDLSDAETVAAGMVQGTVVTRFVVRSGALSRGLKPKDRLTEGGKTWHITGIKERGRSRLLEITATGSLDQ